MPKINLVLIGLYSSLSDLKLGMANLESRIAKEEECSKNVHKANLFPLISCVDALSSLHAKIQEKADKNEDWPITSKLAGRVSKFVVNYFSIYFYFKG